MPVRQWMGRLKEPALFIGVFLAIFSGIAILSLLGGLMLRHIVTWVARMAAWISTVPLEMIGVVIVVGAVAVVALGMTISIFRCRRGSCGGTHGS